MDAARSVVGTNDVILNCSCRDMGVGASYVRAAQHRWPNKPPISGVSLVVVLVRDIQTKKRWIKEEVQNYKVIYRVSYKFSSLLSKCKRKDRQAASWHFDVTYTRITDMYDKEKTSGKTMFAVTILDGFIDKNPLPHCQSHTDTRDGEEKCIPSPACLVVILNWNHEEMKRKRKLERASFGHILRHPSPHSIKFTFLHFKSY
uniref:Uncharacterized protein n=1 Tax=Cucumis melo TaxID=3656 RepID=A0A9I9EM02_CUCME